MSLDERRLPTQASALRHAADSGTDVVAQAHGAAAGALVELAQAHDIPVLQDVALSSALRRLPPGSRIPEGVFQALGCTLDFLLEQDAQVADAPPATGS